MSAFGGKADEIGAKADITARRPAACPTAEVGGAVFEQPEPRQAPAIKSYISHFGAVIRAQGGRGAKYSRAPDRSGPRAQLKKIKKYQKFG